VQHYSLLAANIAGHSKKTVVMGTITAMAAFGGFSGPWAYKGSQAAQGYPDGQIATLSLMAASVFAYVILWYVNVSVCVYDRAYSWLGCIIFLSVREYVLICSI
jgi:hypothetical protein